MSNKEISKKLEELLKLALETKEVGVGLAVVEYMRIVGMAQEGEER